MQHHLFRCPPARRFFRNLLLAIPNTLSDLSSLDAELHKNLLALKRYSGNVQEDVGVCVYPPPPLLLSAPCAHTQTHVHTLRRLSFDVRRKVWVGPSFF